jgi:hypothetical protein
MLTPMVKPQWVRYKLDETIEQPCSDFLAHTLEVCKASKYWTYRSHTGGIGPVSLVACRQQKLDFSPLLHWLFWERSWVRTRGPVGRCAVGWVRSPSSQKQWICSNLLTTMWKVTMCWPREIHMVWDHMRTKRGMCVACWSSFPYRVYIDSNRRDSWIWVIACLRTSARS